MEQWVGINKKADFKKIEQGLRQHNYVLGDDIVMSKKQSLEHTSMVVLSVLSTGDMYGYQMISELEERSNNIFELKEGTLYPVLKKLENEGYIQSYSQEFNGRTRKYYHITNSGLKQLETEVESWKSYSRGIESVLVGTVAFA